MSTVARWSHALVVALLSLLALATSASAEGAWVLWMGPVNPPPGTKAWEGWSPMDSYKTVEPCKADTERNNQRARKSTANQFNYVCLPDTVDPRGPKGK